MEHLDYLGIHLADLSTFQLYLAPVSIPMWHPKISLLLKYSDISDYKTHRIKLNFLPLMYAYDLCDIQLFNKLLRNPSDYFNIIFLCCMYVCGSTIAGLSFCTTLSFDKIDNE